MLFEYLIVIIGFMFIYRESNIYKECYSSISFSEASQYLDACQQPQFLEIFETPPENTYENIKLYQHILYLYRSILVIPISAFLVFSSIFTFTSSATIIYNNKVNFIISIVLWLGMYTIIRLRIASSMIYINVYHLYNNLKPETFIYLSYILIPISINNLIHLPYSGIINILMYTLVPLFLIYIKKTTSLNV